MKNILIISSILILTLLTSCGKIKKTPPTKVVTKENMLDGLHKPSAYSGIPTNFLNKSIPVYTEDAVLLSPEEVDQRNKSGDYIQEAYVNDKNEMVLWISKRMTDEQKKSMFENKNPINFPSPLKGKKAPAFEATDIDGNSISLSKLQGKIIVMSFWFIACKPCIAEIEDLNELVAKCKNKNVVFLGFALDEKKPLVNFLQQRPFHYTIIPQSDPISALYQIKVYPSNLVVDQNGIVVYHTTGLDTNAPQHMLAEIERLEKVN